MARQQTQYASDPAALRAALAPIIAGAYAAMQVSTDERNVVFDRASVRSFDVDGRLHVERTNISKANVCPYMGREIPGYRALGLDPNRIYKLYRDPAELAKAAPTFKNLQLLMLHKPVNAGSPKVEITVGCIGSNIAMDGDYLTADLAVWTAEGIKLIESGAQAQLSPSYRFTPDMTPGTSPDGVAFDGVMRDIMGNHVALVEKGRQGPDVYVSDAQPLELSKMKHSALVAAIVAALASAQVTVSDEAKIAMDAALDTELPKISKEPTALSEEQIALAVDSAISAKGYVTKADADKLASDARLAAVAQVNALHKARKDVEPLVGVVAMDSAEAVYRFALEKSGVAFDGVHESALGVLVEQVKATKAAKAATPAVSSSKIVQDSADALSAAIPGLARIQHA